MCLDINGLLITGGIIQVRIVKNARVVKVLSTCHEDIGQVKKIYIPCRYSTIDSKFL